MGYTAIGSRRGIHFSTLAVYAAPTRAEVYICPAPAINYVAPAPVVEYTSQFLPNMRRQFLRQSTSLQRQRKATPRPLLSWNTVLQLVQSHAPASVVERISPAPTVSYAAPAQLEYAAPVRHAAPTITETGIDLHWMACQMYSQRTSGRLCHDRAVWSTSPIKKTSEYAYPNFRAR